MGVTMPNVVDILPLKTAELIASYTGLKLETITLEEPTKPFRYNFNCSSFTLTSTTVWNKPDKVKFSVYLKEIKVSFSTLQSPTKKPETIARAIKKLIEDNRDSIISEVKAVRRGKQYKLDLAEIRSIISTSILDENKLTCLDMGNSNYKRLPFRNFTGSIDALSDKAYIQMYIPKHHIKKVLNFINKLDLEG